MLKYFKPYKIDSPKVRLGNKSDGGYVVSEIVLQKCTTLFTYGYGGDKSYEDDFIKKYDKPNYIFDHTGHQEKWSQGEQYFYPEGLGSNKPNDDKELSLFEELDVRKNILTKTFSDLDEGKSIPKIKKLRKALEVISETVKNLSDTLSVKDVREHYDEFEIEGDIFLKIDTEGAEYDYFLNTNIDELATFVCGIVVEVHWLEQPQNQERFVTMMEKINKHFVLTHVHGNNWGGEFTYEGHTVPRVAEFSFVNKKYATEYTQDNQDYPIIDLDYPNNNNLADCNLDFLKTL